LRKLNYPTVSYHFIVNDSVEEAKILDMIEAWGRDLDVITQVMNFGTDAFHHRWNRAKFNAMRVMRNKFLDDLKNNDYLFEVDCGVLFPNPDILSHLVSLKKDVVSPVLWARWRSNQVDLLPNVWIRGGYEISREFLQSLKQPGLYRVGGLGAVTLISKKVWECGINYDEIANLPSNMGGEDRSFCVRCVIHGIKLWADTFYPITHLDSVPLKVKL